MVEEGLERLFGIRAVAAEAVHTITTLFRAIPHPIINKWIYGLAQPIFYKSGYLCTVLQWVAWFTIHYYCFKNYTMCFYGFSLTSVLQSYSEYLGIGWKTSLFARELGFISTKIVRLMINHEINDYYRGLLPVYKLSLNELWSTYFFHHFQTFPMCDSIQMAS